VLVCNMYDFPPACLPASIHVHVTCTRFIRPLLID
jgi:hypothetical protein